LKKQILTTLRELPARVSQTALATEPAAVREALPAEQKRTASLKNQLVEHVKKEPSEAGKLLQAWIHEGGK
jgi:flagellar biosynthesis/type III secretory pathway M-ring protein FliF/YscJ